MGNYKWRWFRAGRMSQVKIENGEDIANLATLDRKHWIAISMPVNGERFDKRTLQLMDSDGDGRIRTPEVLAAIDFLKSKNIDLESLFDPSEEDEKALADVLSRRAALAAQPLTKEDEKALAGWEEQGRAPEIATLGADTAGASDALAAVEATIEAFFATPDDMPLVVEGDDKTIPLDFKRINPKFAASMQIFAEKCAKKVLGSDATAIDREGWSRIKAAIAPWRAHIAAKPVANAGLEAALDDEERILRYKLHLVEFLENYVNMKRLYSKDGLAVFQTGVLRIDAKEMKLCFDVENEAAHASLAGRSNCCVIYLKLSRPSEGASRTICAVVTAGAVAQLYAGRNGVFYDRDGKDWDATVTRVVESQVSLAEAFWAPWKKVGESIGSMVKKFLGEKQAAADKAAAEAATLPAAGKGDGSSGGAAMASSVAAIGIGIGMVGAAAASLMAALSRMTPLQIAISVVALVFVVSLPSVVLTWFKLRRRDLGAILNACGWAVNRPMYFSMKRARDFTKCACDPIACKVCFALAILAVAAVAAWFYWCRARG